MKIDDGSVRNHDTRANLILTFHDERHREFLAAAVCGSLVRYEDGSVVEQVDVETLKDRAFTLHGIKVIHHAG